jgi:outer membrane protein assembly factor BamB
MAISGDRLITADTSFGFIQRQTRIAAVSPRSGKPEWEQSFPQKTRFGHGRTLERIAIAPDGTVTTLDMENGARNNVGKLPAEPKNGMPEILTISDSKNVYLMVNHASIDDYSYLSLSSLRANGDLYAFDRTKPDRKWKRSVKGLNLVVSQFGMSPVVLLAGFRTEERGKGVNSLYTQNLDLMALDKSSGREIVRWSGAITGGSPSVMSVDVSNKRIDILSYNERVRLQFPAHSRDEASPSR